MLKNITHCPICDVKLTEDQLLGQYYACNNNISFRYNRKDGSHFVYIDNDMEVGIGIGELYLRIDIINNKTRLYIWKEEGVITDYHLHGQLNYVVDFNLHSKEELISKIKMLFILSN